MINVAVCDGVPLLGISQWFTDISNSIFFWSSQTSLDRSRTCIRAFLKFSGSDDRGYRPQFISCIVLNITFRPFSFINSKNSLYCWSNFHSKTSFAENQFGEIDIWYILSSQNSSFRSFSVSFTSFDRGSNMNAITGKLNSYFSSICCMLFIVLSNDLIPKRYPWVTSWKLKVKSNIKIIIFFIFWN